MNTDMNYFDLLRDWCLKNASGSMYPSMFSSLGEIIAKLEGQHHSGASLSVLMGYLNQAIKEVDEELMKNV